MASTPAPRLPYGPDAQARLLQAERERAVYAGQPISLVANVVLAALLFWVAPGTMRMAPARIWLSALGLLVAVRAGVYLAWRFRHDREGAHFPFLAAFRIGALGTGAVWGILPWILFPSATIEQRTYVAFVIAGLSAGAVTSLTADRESALGFTFLAVAPLIARLTLDGGVVQGAMGVSVTLFLLFVSVSAIRGARQFVENVRLRAVEVEQAEKVRAAMESERRLERERSEANTRYEQLLRDLGGKFVVFNHSFRSGEVTLVSEGAESVFGMLPDEIIGRPWTESVAWFPEDVEAARARVVQGLSRGNYGPELTLRFRHPDGRTRTVRIVEHLIGGDGGEIVAVEGLVEDITAHREAEDRLEESRRLAALGHWEADLGTGTLKCSQSVYDLLGRDPKAIRKLSDFCDAAHPDDREALGEGQRRALAEGSYDLVHRIVRSDGAIRHLHTFVRLVRGRNSEPKWLVGAVQDVTDRVRAQEELLRLNAVLEARVAERSAELLESVHLLRGTTDALQTRLAVLDTAGRIVTLNRAWHSCADSGGPGWMRASEGESYPDALRRAKGKDAQVAASILRAVEEGMAGRSSERPLEFKAWSGGSERWFVCRVTPFSFGQDSRLVVVFDDVTEVRQAIARALEGEEVVSSLTRLSPAGVFQAESSGQWIGVSDRLTEIMGHAREDLLGEGWESVLHPEDLDRVRKAWETARQGQTPFRLEYRVLRADGSVVRVVAQALAVGKDAEEGAAYVGTVTDVTGIRKVEHATRLVSTELLELSGDAFHQHAAVRLAQIVGADAVVIGKATARAGTGRTLAVVEAGELLPNFDHAIDASLLDRFHMADGCLIETGAPAGYMAGIVGMTASARTFVGKALADRTGHVLGHVSIMSRTPLRDLESVEQAVRIVALAVSAEIVRERARAEYRDLFDFSPSALVLSDHEQRVVLLNRRAEALFGWTRDDVRGRSLKTLWRAREERTESGTAVVAEDLMGLQGHVEGLRRDGTTFIGEVHEASVQTEGGNMRAFTVADITERLAVEERLAQATKMEAIGNLTGGIAHDFNNYLGIILGNLDLLKSAYSLGEDEAVLVQEAISGAQRGADLTKSLLAFSRRQSLEPRVTDLNRKIGSLVSLLKRSLGENVDLVTSFTPDLWNVKVDGARLDSCIVNLAANARDAMPGGGRLTLSTEAVVIDESAQTSNGPKPGRYVAVTVTDNGIGMDEATRARVFEPYFTTKEYGRGSGLGLSMVYGFVQQSGGHVDVESEVGRGTKVSIYLPAAGGVEIAPKPSEARAERGVERILVVEDNLAVRRTVKAQLQALGYEVIEAEDGASALTILTESALHIDLLFSDVVMPGPLNGFALATEASRLRPDLPILLTSGFPGDASESGDLDGSRYPMLPKPYRGEDLAASIRAVLDGVS